MTTDGNSDQHSAKSTRSGAEQPRSTPSSPGELWYFQVDGTANGPFSAKELRGYARSGKIKASTLVRKGEAGTWRLAARIRGLIPSSDEVNPTEQKQNDQWRTHGWKQRESEYVERSRTPGFGIGCLTMLIGGLAMAVNDRINGPGGETASSVHKNTMGAISVVLFSGLALAVGVGRTYRRKFAKSSDESAHWTFTISTFVFGRLVKHRAFKLRPESRLEVSGGDDLNETSATVVKLTGIDGAPDSVEVHKGANRKDCDEYKRMLSSELGIPATKTKPSMHKKVMSAETVASAHIAGHSLEVKRLDGVDYLRLRQPDFDAELFRISQDARGKAFPEHVKRPPLHQFWMTAHTVSPFLTLEFGEGDERSVALCEFETDSQLSAVVKFLAEHAGVSIDYKTVEEAERWWRDK